MGHACCATFSGFAIQPLPGKKGASRFKCSACNPSGMLQEKTNCLDLPARGNILAAFKAIVDMPDFNGLRRPRVAAMLALRRLATHAADSEFLNLETSSSGLWCMKSLSSSNRELRIASCRTLPAFLHNWMEDGSLEVIIQQNRAFALQALSSISDQELPHLAETCIMAWSHIGCMVSDDQLNLVLVKLVDYLSHRNAIISAAAFDEILNLARSRNVSPRELFQPYWKSIAFSAVKDMGTKPKLTRSLAELLEVSTPELLLVIQREALPWLVLKGKSDVIQQIADARKEKDSWQPCLDKNNLGPIVALLLVQSVPDVEAHAMTLLRQISPHFQGFSLGDLILVEPVLIYLELLKAAGEAEEDRKPHVSLPTCERILVLTSEPDTASTRSDGQTILYRKWGSQTKEERPYWSVPSGPGPWPCIQSDRDFQHIPRLSLNTGGKTTFDQGNGRTSPHRKKEHSHGTPASKSKR